MILVDILCTNPAYPQYRTDITIVSPWYNNTQIIHAAYDQVSERIRYSFENASSQICDLTIGFSQYYLYGRTMGHNYQCTKNNQEWNETYIEMVPNLENWSQLEDEVIHGVKCSHYQFKQVNSSLSSNMTYNDATTFQQDFWCSFDNKTDFCLPLRFTTGWFYFEIKQNNKDNFIIEYQNFQPLVLDSDFEFDFYGANCLESSQSNHKISRKFSALDLLKKSNIFQRNQNLASIKSINSNEEFTFKAAPNHFIHRDISIPKRKIVSSTQESTVLSTPLAEDLPTNFDWRTRGVMTEIKDQEFCGGCWIFSATGTLESAINIARQKANSNQSSQPNIVLSEQQFIDCYWDSIYATGGGCEGGDAADLMQTWVGRAAFASLRAYPYLGEDDWCKSRNDILNFNVTAFHAVPKHDIVQLKRAIMRGPVSVGTATPSSFMFYSSGIYNDPACQGENIDHFVIAVGWGESNYGPYWVVRNSWSPYWGVDGYIYIAMKGGVCGITAGPFWLEVGEV